MPTNNKYPVCAGCNIGDKSRPLIECSGLHTMLLWPLLYPLSLLISWVFYPCCKKNQPCNVGSCCFSRGDPVCRGESKNYKKIKLIFFFLKKKVLLLHSKWSKIYFYFYNTFLLPFLF